MLPSTVPAVRTHRIDVVAGWTMDCKSSKVQLPSSSPYHTSRNEEPHFPGRGGVMPLGDGCGGGSSGEDTEDYDVDEKEAGKSRTGGTGRKNHSSTRPSTSGEADTSLILKPKSGKQKKRLENILHRLLTHQDEDKPNITNAASEMSPPDSGGEEKSVSNAGRAPPGGAATLQSGLTRRKARRTVREPARKDVGGRLVNTGRLAESVHGNHREENTPEMSTSTVRDGEQFMFDDEKTSDSTDHTAPLWWTCFLCNIPFSDASAMLTHMQEHAGVESYPCGKCGDDFTSLEALRLHIDEHLQTDGQRRDVHPCHLCGKSFFSMTHLVRHLAAHGTGQVVKQEVLDPDVTSPDNKGSNSARETDSLAASVDLGKHHRCGRCRRTFTTNDALQLHKCRKGLVKPFGCGRCGRCFTQFSNLKEHAVIHDGDLTQELECYECGLKFMYSIELRRHVSTHIKSEQALSLLKSRSTSSAGEGELPFQGVVLPKRRSGKGKRKRPPITDANQCKVCGKFFPQRSYLQLHMQTHNEKRFSCQYCEKKFTFKKSLEIHVRTHTGEKPYQCDLCPRQFTRQDALHKHRRIHLGVKPYVCDICGRQFGDSFELRRHINAHNQEKPYKCNQCDKAYSDNTRLKEHMFRHTGNMPYICERCGKGFARKYRYNLHMSQHAGEVKFSCETCGRGFLRRSDYNTHMLTHTTEKPFKCKVCGMGFIRDNYLKRHELVHSGEKPFTCEVCGKDFKRKNTLNRHMQTHSRSAEKSAGDEGYSIKFRGMAGAAGSGVTSILPVGSVSSNVGLVSTNSGSVDPVSSGVGPVSSNVGEERDIMRDIQAVIGVSVASMFSEVM